MDATSLSSEFTKEIHGATVNFNLGAEVSMIKLASDFSTIQITGLDGNNPISSVMKFFSELGFLVYESNITLKISSCWVSSGGKNRRYLFREKGHSDV